MNNILIKLIFLLISFFYIFLFVFLTNFTQSLLFFNKFYKLSPFFLHSKMSSRTINYSLDLITLNSLNMIFEGVIIDILES